MESAPTPGRLYLIKNKCNQLVLEVEGSMIAPGTKVHCWEHKPRGDFQVWSYDPQTLTIRPKLNPLFCLDFDQGKNHLVVNPINPQSVFQQWIVNGGQIKSRANESNVVDLYGMHKHNGATVGIYTNNMGEHQKFEWILEDGGMQQLPGYPTNNPAGYGHMSNCPPVYPPSNPNQPAYPAMGQSLQGPGNNSYESASGGIGLPALDLNSRRKFLILTEIDGKSLDIRGDSKEAGAQLIMYKSHRKMNQQWYLDQYGFIRSCFNDFVFYNKDKGHGLTMQPYQDEPGHKWKIDGRRIVNMKGEVLDIRGGKSKDGAELCAYTPNNQANQNWNIQYI